MPIYGTKNYGDVDRFGNFLKAVVGQRMQTDVAIGELERTAKEREAVSSIFQPLVKMTEGVEAETPTAAEPEGKAPAEGLTDLSGQQGEKSLAARNNNPLNLKWTDWQGKFHGQPGDSTQYGTFTKFPSVEFGLLAAEENLRKNYGDMDIDAAMKRWSGAGVQGKGYGAEIAPELKGKKIGELSDEELSGLIDRMAKREGVLVGGQQVDLSGAQEKAKEIGRRMEGKLDPRFTGEMVQYGARGITPQQAEPSSTAVSKKTKVFPSESEVDQMEIQTFAKLLSRGTPQAMQAADKLAKMRVLRSQYRKPESYLLGQETYEGPEGEKKLIDIYGYQTKQGKVVTERKYTDVTPYKDVEEAKVAAANLKLQQKYTEQYNKADNRIKQISSGRGGGDLVQGQRELDKDYYEALQNPEFQTLMASSDDMVDMVLLGMDPKTKSRYKELYDYAKAKGDKGAAIANLKSIDLEMNEEKGQAVPFGTVKKPSRTGKRYFD